MASPDSPATASTVGTTTSGMSRSFFARLRSWLNSIPRSWSVTPSRPASIRFSIAGMAHHLLYQYAGLGEPASTNPGAFYLPVHNDASAESLAAARSIRVSPLGDRGRTLSLQPSGQPPGQSPAQPPAQPQSPNASSLQQMQANRPTLIPASDFGMMPPPPRANSMDVQAHARSMESSIFIRPFSSLRQPIDAALESHWGSMDHRRSGSGSGSDTSTYPPSPNSDYTAASSSSVVSLGHLETLHAVGGAEPEPPNFPAVAIVDASAFAVPGHPLYSLSLSVSSSASSLSFAPPSPPRPVSPPLQGIRRIYASNGPGFVQVRRKQVTWPLHRTPLLPEEHCIKASRSAARRFLEADAEEGHDMPSSV